MNLKSLGKITEGWESGKKMPVFFVGHGNPMNGILENETTKGWRQMAEGLKPKAILCISAHWQTRGTLVTMAPNPRTIHDFGGFPKELFDVQYPAPGSPEMAREVIDQVKKVTVEEDHEWGLDHGTWTVLTKMFPEADVPVFQLSLDFRQAPQFHYELGQELSNLREKGVLVVGSGNLVHNLRMANWNSSEPYEWNRTFDEKAKQLMERREHEDLIHYSRLGRAAELSIPTNEHYLPMLYSLALQDDRDELTFFNETLEMGSISMRSFVLSQTS